jgi:hypothetical protein
VCAAAGVAQAHPFAFCRGQGAPLRPCAPKAEGNAERNPKRKLYCWLVAKFHKPQGIYVVPMPATALILSCDRRVSRIPDLS